MLDLLVCTTCYRSTASLLRLAHSLQLLHCSFLLVVAAPLEEDLVILRQQLSETDGSWVLLHTEVNSTWWCRGAAWLWTYRNGIRARTLLICDERIEFTDASRFLTNHLLQLAQQHPYCLAVFQSHPHPYLAMESEAVCGKVVINPQWVSDDAMFIPYTVVEQCGLPDTDTSVSMTSSTEVEYTMRLRCLTHQPVVADCSQPEWYIHHFREDAALTVERAARATEYMEADEQFWCKKYGIERPDFLSPFVYAWLWQQMQHQPPAKLRSHLMFAGADSGDWFGLWKSIRRQVRTFCERIQ